MKSQELVVKWLAALSEKTGRSVEELKEDGLFADDFSYPGIRINFEDRSYMVFKYAFALQDDAYPNVIAVFTEHNGYYEFPFGEEDDLIVNK
jgi:hypothetical protein